MPNDSVVLRFDNVSFAYSETKPILDEANFSVRNGSRIALMGQNGAGKTSLFNLILRRTQPNEGGIFLTPKEASVGIAKQVVAPEHLDLTVREFFASTFVEVPYNLDKQISRVLDAVQLTTDLTKKVRAHSGGQLARLLLAYSLLQDPDILLLDEPTNNLDQAGIDHLTGFLMTYDKTVIVISHDAEFLNAFTDGVLYLDINTHKVEQYAGNYLDVVREITERLERERRQNARAEAEIKKKVAQAEVFAHKGGKLRLVAKKMRLAAEEAEENMVEVRQEDKTIRPFTIPTQVFPADFNGKILELTHVSVIKAGEHVAHEANLVLKKGFHLLIAGPNGIGKSTFLEKLSQGTAKGATLGAEVRVGYYRQDFSTLNLEQTGYASLEEVMEKPNEHTLRSMAAGFLLDGKVLASQIKSMSEGQKGLLALARLVLIRPGLLILDEPTNHINFRHLPVIAKALDAYEGALILVSHIPDFVKQVRIDHTVDLGAL
ncbi:MAG: ATP-binding cassette domain-containing protein [Candidatus Veblenbacteria bacterium]|nr:ATP-binding cassette domain-containing protein [Candidatus Veblenbacteria bacterium]